MKILLIHNYYQLPGGEDAVFKNEGNLLRQNGHVIEEVTFKNKEIVTWSDKLAAGLKTIYHPRSAKIVEEKINKFRPDVVHVHNFFPLASPAVFFVAARLKVPIVVTVHNYRLICPSATLFFKGRLYENNIGKIFPWHGVVHGVYRGSRFQTLAVALMLSIHNLMGTWRNKVSSYITLTQFAKEKLLQSALHIPQEKVHVKPNFIPDPGKGEAVRQDFFLFVGRLTEEKGIGALLEAVESRLFDLVVIGDGPLRGQVEQAAKTNSRIHFLGQQNHDNVLFFLKNCKALIFPSIWYEGFPVILLEAFATGTLVISSNLGSMPEIVQNNVNGLLVEAGNTQELVARVSEVMLNPVKSRLLGENARSAYRTHYTPAINYNQLMDIYLQAVLTNSSQMLHQADAMIVSQL